MEDLLRIGVVTTTHGIKGEVKVFPTTDDIKRFKKCDEVILITKEGKEVLFPVIPDCIKKVDTKEGIVRAHVMKGLIE